MKAIRKAVAVTGTYTDRQTGQEKKRYTNMGTLFKDEEKGTLSLKLDSLPVGGEWNGWVSFYELDGKRVAEKAGLPPTQQQSPADDFDEEIPF